MTKFELFLMGHGGYNPTKGQVTLPEDFTMFFYSHHGAGLPEAKIQSILRGQEKPVRTFNAGDTFQNYSWCFGEPANWNFYVIGGPNVPDTRRRKGLSPRPELNTHLQKETRFKEWDVRYVEYFRKLRNEDPATFRKSGCPAYTLKDLFEEENAVKWWSSKAKPCFVHSVLCSSLIEVKRDLPP